MECQREGTRRIRLTDQALVAVAIARGRAGMQNRSATVVDLLLGLAAEPDGLAGRALREREHAVADLERRAFPTLAPIELALSWAAKDAAARPVNTLDLLRTALESGGGELADALEAAGLERSDVGVREPPYPLAAAETVGLRSPDTPDPDLSPEAALAVARTRAVAGGAIDLLVAVARGPQIDTEPTAMPDPSEIVAAARRLEKRGDSERSQLWDLGLDHVLNAARAWRSPEQVAASDLVRAALLVGGDGPSAVLAEAQRPSRPPHDQA